MRVMIWEIKEFSERKIRDKCRKLKNISYNQRMVIFKIKKFYKEIGTLLNWLEIFNRNYEKKFLNIRFTYELIFK